MNDINLPDGEYDIDISHLKSLSKGSLDSSQQTEENFAIRYGFTPDSMNNESKFILYKDLTNSNEYYLKTEALDSKESIIFEGVSLPQPSSSSSRNLEYLLIYNEADKKFELKILNSTIRMNKSRNKNKLSQKIETIESLNLSVPNSQNGTTNATNISSNGGSNHSLVEKRETSPSPSIQKKPSTVSAANGIVKKPVSQGRGRPKSLKTKLREKEREEKEREREKKLQPAIKVASKRPFSNPVPSSVLSTPVIDDTPIISESDFEEFNFEFGDNEESNNKDNSSVAVVNNSSDGNKNITEIETPRQNQTSNKKPPTTSLSNNYSRNFDNDDVQTPGKESSDDEFGDLAIQLEEVLESDEDEDDDAGGGFQIEIDEREESRKQDVKLSSIHNGIGNRNGPISLRGLVDRGRREEDELSSSEEE